MKGDECSFKGCGKIAIGYQSGLNWGFNVCEAHAHRELINMNPGEKIDERKEGGYYYHKYDMEG